MIHQDRFQNYLNRVFMAALGLEDPVKLSNEITQAVQDRVLGPKVAERMVELIQAPTIAREVGRGLST